MPPNLPGDVNHHQPTSPEPRCHHLQGGSPPPNAHIVATTAAWLESHGFTYHDLCFVDNKVDVSANLYLDDSPKVVAGLRLDCRSGRIRPLLQSTPAGMAHPELGYRCPAEVSAYSGLPHCLRGAPGNGRLPGPRAQPAEEGVTALPQPPSRRRFAPAAGCSVVGKAQKPRVGASSYKMYATLSSTRSVARAAARRRLKLASTVFSVYPIKRRTARETIGVNRR